MNQKYRGQVSPEERGQLEQVVRTGRTSAATQTRARILLKGDRAEGGPRWPDAAIAEALDVSVATVERVRKRFVTQGLEAATRRKPTTRPPQWKLDGAQEAHRAARACSAPPAGAGRWTLRLLAAKVVELKVVDSIARDTVRVARKKTRLANWA
jgi:hypothetical protein